MGGYAIGGLSGGESKSDFWRMVTLSTDLLPDEKPRYLMGVGYVGHSRIEPEFRHVRSHMDEGGSGVITCPLQVHLLTLSHTPDQPLSLSEMMAKLKICSSKLIYFLFGV